MAMRIFRWRPPPFGAAIFFVGVIIAGALALMWIGVERDGAALRPWLLVLVLIVAGAGVLAVRHAVMQPPVKRETRPPGAG